MMPRLFSVLRFVLLLAGLGGAADSIRAADARTLSVKPTENAGSEKRVALVIGNSAYASSPLVNPVNDARAMAAKLRGLGFEVQVHENLAQKDMNRAVTRFGEALGEGAVGLLFYAGHGMQVKGRNYLIPVDADIRSEAAIRNEAVDVEQVMEQMEAAKTGLNIVILDACRNNPFERRFRSAGGGGGLASMDAPKGTLIAYATGPGKVASDGNAGNGLYTSEILKVIDEPGLRIEDVFKRVRLNVARETNDAQLPWETSSLVGDFFFSRSASPGVAPNAGSVTTIEIEALEEEMQVVAPTTATRSAEGQGTIATLKAGDWVRVTGRMKQAARYRVMVEGKGVAYVPVNALESPWFRRIGRLYRGAIGNNVRKPDQVVTRFDFMNGRLFGTYTIVEPDGKTDGVLEDFTMTGPRSGRFTWKDPYGSGTLEVEFKNDLAGFSGTWKVTAMPDQGGSWSGTRQ